MNEHMLNTISKDKWERIGMQRRAGILIPLFSVYSKDSIGLGELADLKLVIDWCDYTRNSIIQLLPLNEVGSLFCPYDSISSFALEPSYISLKSLVKPNKMALAIQNKIEDIKNKFPGGQAYVDYRIKEEKIHLLWEIFSEEYLCDSEELNEFREANKYWINDFALFKVLKDYQGQKAWYDWEDRYKNRDAYYLEIFQKEHEKEIAFQIWVQWQLYKQLKEVKSCAEVKNVLLKGDLPILVSRDSADVWAHPEFFKLDFASGAPPDMYCAKGQRWGMPPHDWERISADGYRYLKAKLSYAQNFYDILRIDHVVGLFRIWSIPYNEPLENQGLNGFFDSKDQSKWGDHGRTILSVILNSTNMLLCAEDLGVIPKVCTDTLKELGIPGNDVQRWVKDWKVKHDFLKPKDYRLLSVAMLSTHDTTNWPAWWEYEAGTIDEALFRRKCAERGIDYNYVKVRLFNPDLSRYGRLRWLNSVNSADKLIAILGKRKEEVSDFMEMYKNTYKEKEKLWGHFAMRGPMREESDTEIMRAALKISLDSRAIFCINTIIDWLYLGGIFKGDPYQYRVNTPGTISEKNWSLVIPISLEELLRHEINPDIRDMIVSSDRI